jgi:hypothetical protein
MDADVEPLYVEPWLGGNARTGKSLVIHAFLTLAPSWQWPSVIMVVIHMELVAVNSEDRIIHAAFNFSLNNKPRSVQLTAKEIEMFA